MKKRRWRWTGFLKRESRDWQPTPAGGNWIRQMFGQQHPRSPPRDEFAGTGSQQGTAGFISHARQINKEKAAIAASPRGWEVYYRRKAPENAYVNVQRGEMKTISKRCKVPATAPCSFHRSCFRFGFYFKVYYYSINDKTNNNSVTVHGNAITQNWVAFLAPLDRLQWNY